MSKQQPSQPAPRKSSRKVTQADDLLKTTQGGIELTEAELGRASGGMAIVLRVGLKI